MGKPDGFEDCLDFYGPYFHDAICGEPVEWGYKLTKRLGEERFAQLRATGRLQYLRDSEEWIYVVKRLTKQEAIEKYGPVTEDEGDLKKNRKITFGGKTFFASNLDGLWDGRWTDRGPNAVSVGPQNTAAIDPKIADQLERAGEILQRAARLIRSDSMPPFETEQIASAYRKFYSNFFDVMKDYCDRVEPS